MVRFGGRKNHAAGSQYKISKNAPNTVETPSRDSNYEPGRHVEHPTFGAGRITGSEGVGDKQKVTILFGDGVERRLMVKFANLMIR
jgi:hypothetical protein